MKKKIFWIFVLIGIILLIKLGKDVFAAERIGPVKKTVSNLNLLQEREENLRQRLHSLNQITSPDFLLTPP